MNVKSWRSPPTAKNLLIKKNKDYGNSYDKTLDEFGIQIGLVRIEDKLNRLKTLILSTEHPMVEESIIDTVFDIAGYAVLFSIYLKEQGSNKGGKWETAAE